MHFFDLVSGGFDVLALRNHLSLSPKQIKIIIGRKKGLRARNRIEREGYFYFRIGRGGVLEKKDRVGGWQSGS